MLHLKVQLRFKETQKGEKNVKKKMHLTLQLMVHLTMQSKMYL